MSRLRIEALRFRGGGPIDLTVEPGECVTLCGASGSGKTLLLRALADLDAHGGRVFLDEVECDCVPAPAWRRLVGMLPTESCWWHETVGEHFASADPGSLERLGFGLEVLGCSAARLSTGERHRLALLRLLALRPRALLLDEPTANLDPHSAERVEGLIADYRRSVDAPVLWVTHDGEQAQRLARRRFRLAEGRLLAEGPP